ncbi:MAG: TolC family protein, partial [Deferrisomatales bacterium]
MSSRRTLGLFALLMLGLPPPARAAPEPLPQVLAARITEGPALSDLVAYAYQSSPQIRAARLAWKASVEQHRVTTAYPDPQLMVTHFPRPIETRLGPQDWNATLTQMVPFPGKLGVAGEIAEADARLARIELDKAVRDVVVQVRESYHELRYIGEARRTVDRNRELLDHLRKLAETSYADDRATLVDVTKAQSQSAQLTYDALLLDELAETERARLNALLDRAPDAPLGPLAEAPARPLAYDLAEIDRLAEVNQEELRAAATLVDKARAREDLARYQNLPELRVGLFYASIGEPDVPAAARAADAGRDAVGVQAGLTIPLWLGRNAGRVEAARAEAARARAVLGARRNDTRAQVRSLFFRLRNAERLVGLYRDELLPQA